MPDPEIEFVDVVDFDGSILIGYQVSRCGKMRSRRLGGKGTNRLREKWKPLNPPRNNFGYHMASICQGGGVVLMRQVHALVLLAFVGPRPTPQHQCRHLNGIRHDNRVENLCWGTAQENKNDQYRHGTEAKGTKVNTCKMTEEQVLEIRRLHSEGERLCNLSRQFGLKSCTIGQIVERRSWKHI